MFFGKYTTGDLIIDKLLYMGLSIMAIFSIIFFIIPFLARMMAIPY